MFDEEKDLISASDITSENEDIEVNIEELITLNEDTVFEDCNILFDLTKGGRIKVNKKKLKVIDSTVVFKGYCKECVMEIVDGEVLFDGCKFSQIDSLNKYNRYISMSKSGCIDISSTSITDLQGVFVQSVGANVFFDDCEVKELSGILCEATKVDNYKIKAPSAKFKKITFEKCSFPKKISWDREISVIPDSWGTIAPSLIYTFELINTVVEACKFIKCKERCINISNTDLPNPSTIKDCEFIDCSHKVEDSYDSMYRDKEAYSVYLRKTEVTMSNCKFSKSWGVYSHSQCSSANFDKCIFLNCIGYSSFEKYGILSIFNEVNKPCINVTNCEFDKCKTNEMGTNSGLITISAGEPEKKQAETVIISKCKYKNCKSDHNISGTEKQSGFFGKTIVLYKEK